jgi:3-oxoadipate enol-lactonase
MRSQRSTSPTVSGPSACPPSSSSGEDDQGTPVAASRAIQERIPGAELVVLKSASHLSNVEQPAAFTSALATHLARAARS